jgi:hypothetical protein
MGAQKKWESENRCRNKFGMTWDPPREIRHKYFKNKELRANLVAKKAVFWQKYPLFVTYCKGVNAEKT